jgi:hypothetical protein
VEMENILQNYNDKIDLEKATGVQWASMRCAIRLSNKRFQ